MWRLFTLFNVIFLKGELEGNKYMRKTTQIKKSVYIHKEYVKRFSVTIFQFKLYASIFKARWERTMKKLEPKSVLNFRWLH